MAVVPEVRRTGVADSTRTARLTVRSELDGVLLRIHVSVTNALAGHKLPTGVSFRNILLVVGAEDGSAALDRFNQESVDLAVLDIVMPGRDGLDVCRSIRERSDVAILFLSSRDEELDRILGLEMGADDYVTKPFSPRELVARVKAMLRRTTVGRHETAGDEARLEYGPLTLDPQQHRCCWHGEEIFLTATEFMLLRSLLVHPRRVCSRAELVERAYGHGHHITERTVDSHVRRIRKKFSQFSVDPIETVFGVGYRMREKDDAA